MVKLVAFDVDGTLRDRDYMPESTKEAVAELKRCGVEMALCTGRSEFELKSLQQELGIDWAVTCNGAHIGHWGKTIFGTPFAHEKVQQWLQTAEQKGHTLLLYGAEFMFTNRAGAPHFRQAQEEIGFLEPVLLGKNEHVPAIYQCIAFVDETSVQDYIGNNAAEERYYLHRWRSWAVDINPRGTNKAAGLRCLLDHLNIDAQEAAAFGDGRNDLELLEYVGTGIAMGNAPDDVKTRARHVTKTLNEGGIAYGVKHFLLA
jgi:hypothetical protein